MEEKEIKEAVEATKDELADKAAENLKPTDDENKLIEDALKEVNGPIVLRDDKLVLGNQEVDIRKLSKTNKDQLMFRLALQQLGYNRFMNQTFTDILRLLMVIIKVLKPGCNLSEEIDGVMDKLAHEIKERTQPTKPEEKLN